MRLFTVLLIVFLISITFFAEKSFASEKANKQLVTIDFNKKYQEIDNFGASGSWSIDEIGEEWSQENRKKIADLLFSKEKGIGLSAWRFHIGAGSEQSDKNIIKDRFRRAETFKPGKEEPYNWNKMEGQQWFLKAAVKRGVKDLIAIAYSPPFWMTKNGHTQPNKSVGTTNIEKEKIDNFARYLGDIIKHFNDQENIKFDYLSPVNEPYWDWNRDNQEGNRYAIKDMKKLIKELHKRFEKYDLDTEILVTEA